MKGREAILNKIAVEADLNAAKIIKDANAEAQSLIENAKLEAKAELQNKLSKAKAEFEEAKQRKAVSNENAAKVVLINAQEKAIDSCFEKAAEKLRKLSDAEYKKFFGNLILSVAEDGDEVIVSEKDKKIFTAEYIGALATKAKVKMTLSKEKGATASGVKLIGKYSDRTISIEALISQVKKDMEPEIANLLLKETK
jgi:V/A-type H+-transporting ATPase subunit E